MDKLQKLKHLKSLGGKEENVNYYLEKIKKADTVFSVHLISLTTVVFLRTVSFISGNTYSYSWGGFIAVVTIFLIFLATKKINTVLLIIFSISLGVWANDFFPTVSLGQNMFSYWGMENLIVIIFLALIPIFLFRGNFFKSPILSFGDSSQKHINPEDPEISVVIPAYNEAKYIENTLKSLLSQKDKDFELIVVDNASSDNTKEMAERFGAKVIIEKKRGIANARNTGFLNSKGDIIACTDADTIVPQDWILNIKQIYEQEKDLVGLGGLALLYSGPVTARAAARFLFPLFWKLDKLLSGGWNMSGFNMSVKKDAFLKTGGFNNKLQMNEDVDLSKKLRSLGKIDINPKLLAFSSGRRYKNGLFFGILTYVPSWILRTIFRQEVNFKFPTVRKESSFMHKLRFIPLTVIILVLIWMFDVVR